MIRAYQIDSFYVDQLSGKALVEVSFGMKKDALKTFVHPLSSVDAANQYLDREARDWFLGCLEKFVNHKAHIIQDEKHQQWANLKTCQLALEKYDTYATNKICAKFLKGYGVFAGILPHPHNDSYASSEHDLKELKRFCEEFLKFKPYQEAKT